MESTISVIYRHSMPDATSPVNQATPGSLQMESCSLSLPLSQLPHHEPAPEIPSAFSLPTPTQDTLQHPILIMHRIQSHVHGKVFGAEKDLNRFVRHLIQVSCPASQLPSLLTNMLLLTTKKKRKKMTMIMKIATISPTEKSFSPYGSLPERTHTESNPGH